MTPESLGLEILRLVGGGFKGLLFDPGSREWYGWWIPMLLAGIWHYHAVNKRKKLDLEGGLNYVFPTSTYLSASFVHDVVTIGLKFVIFRVILRLFMKIEIEDFVFMHWTMNALSRGLRSFYRPELKAGLAVNLAFSFCAVIAYEFCWWLMHWLTHKIPVLWAFHAVHHSTTKMNPLASKRVHFLDEALLMVAAGAGLGVVYVLFRVFGYTPDTVLIAYEIPLFQLGFLLFGVARHSHIPISFGKLEAVFSSPHMHQVHHSYKPEHINKNFGNNLVLFDELFGTLYRPRVGEEVLFGISAAQAKENQGFIRLYFLQPLLDVRDYLRAGLYFSFPSRAPKA